MNNETKKYDIAIIGAGAAGMMAALRGVLNNDSVLLFGGNAKDKKKSRAQWVRKVENIPGFHKYEKGILDPNKEALEFIESSPFASNLTFLDKLGVTKVRKNAEGTFTLVDDNEESYEASFVILATGVMDVQPQVEGSIKAIFPYANVQSVDYCIRCDGHHILNKETAIIGKDSSAAWIAILLKERYDPPNITIITDGTTPEYGDDLKELLDLYNIDVITKGLDGVKGDQQSGTLEGFYFCDGTFVPTDFAFISLGMLVYNKLATELGASVDERGFVTTTSEGESSVEGFYISGDLRANTKKQIYTAWDTAVDAADSINKKLRILKRQKKLESKRA